MLFKGHQFVKNLKKLASKTKESKATLRASHPLVKQVRHLCPYFIHPFDPLRTKLIMHSSFHGQNQKHMGHAKRLGLPGQCPAIKAPTPEMLIEHSIFYFHSKRQTKRAISGSMPLLPQEKIPLLRRTTTTATTASHSAA